MAASLDLFPRQTGGRVADLAGLLRRVLQPVAGSTVLQDEPPLIDGVPEGLAQRVGDGDQLWHGSIACVRASNHSDGTRVHNFVMPGLDPGIHGNRHGLRGIAWMAGSSPAMTSAGSTCVSFAAADPLAIDRVLAADELDIGR